MTDNLIERARFVVQLFRECDAIQLPHKPTEETLLGMINRIERLAAERDALKAEVERLRVAFRVNILRFAPDVSHADIDDLLAGPQVSELETERDALKAEVKRLRSVLTEMRDDKAGFRHVSHFRRRAAVALQESTDD
jgi:hypothetical protein